MLVMIWTVGHPRGDDESAWG